MTAATTSPHSSSGTPTTAHSAHGGVLEEDVLDLAGGEVLATSNDDVVEPSLDIEVPALIEYPLVVGGEPSFSGPSPSLP